MTYGQFLKRELEALREAAAEPDADPDVIEERTRELEIKMAVYRDFEDDEMLGTATLH